MYFTVDGGGIAYAGCVTGCSIPGRGEKFLFTLKVHPFKWVAGALSFGVKRPGREADHSSRDDVKSA